MDAGIDKQTPLVNLSNARVEEQREVMEKIQRINKCPFCPKSLDKFHKREKVMEGEFWILTKNRWPYDHTTVHLLAIYKSHAVKLRDITPEAGAELFRFFQWAESTYQIDAGAFAVRFGDIRLNGATVSHLHAHLIEPDSKNPNHKTVRFKMG